MRSCIFNPIDWIRGLFGKRKDRDYVKADDLIHGDAVAAYSRAKGIVRQVLGKTPKDDECQVRRVDGGRKIKGYWCWQDPYFGKLWIAGMYWSGKNPRIDAGVNPKNGREWHTGTLLHEVMHHFLFKRGIRTHDPRFDGLVPGWADTRKAGLPFLGIAGWSKLHQSPVVFIRQIHRYGNGDDDIVMVDVIAEEAD